MTPEWIETGLIAFTTFFATIGPVDVAAIFAGLTVGLPSRQRRQIAFKGVTIAAGILFIFALTGNQLMEYMGISLAALRTAGGVLLLLVGIDMVMAKNAGLNSTTDIEAEEAHHRNDISVFPLATPLIAGAGTMGASVLLIAQAEGDLVREGIVLGALLAVLLITLVLLLLATGVQKLLGVTGLNVISRVMGVLVTALAIQFIFDGLLSSGLFNAGVN